MEGGREVTNDFGSIIYKGWFENMYFVETNLQMHELTIEGLDLFIVIKNYGQCISFFQLAYFRVKISFDF